MEKEDCLVQQEGWALEIIKPLREEHKHPSYCMHDKHFLKLYHTDDGGCTIFI